MIEELLAGHSLAALFGVSFLASTLLPLGSEWLLVSLLLEGQAPFPVVATATAGNTLGALTSYAIGWYGAAWLMEKVLRVGEGARERAHRFFARYGSWSLLFSWLPVIGDPLCVAAGLLRVHPAIFFLLVAGGKLARYAAVAWFTLKAAAS